MTEEARTSGDAELDPTVRAWLLQGPRHFSEAARQTLVAETAVTPQRAAAPSALRMLMFAAAGVAAVVALSVAYLAASGGLSWVRTGSDASPTPRATVSSTPQATLWRTGRSISFEYEIPSDLPMEIYEASNRRYVDPQGYIVLTVGGPANYGQETDDPASFVGGSRGIAIADLTDAYVGHGEPNGDLAGDPLGFLSDLDATTLFDVSGISRTEIDGLAGAVGRVTLVRDWYSHLDHPEGGALDLRYSTELTVVRVNDTLVGIQAWAETDEALDAWLPDAQRVIQSIRFTDVSGEPVEGSPR